MIVYTMINSINLCDNDRFFSIRRYVANRRKKNWHRFFNDDVTRDAYVCWSNEMAADGNIDNASKTYRLFAQLNAISLFSRWQPFRYKKINHEWENISKIDSNRRGCAVSVFSHKSYSFSRPNFIGKRSRWKQVATLRHDWEMMSSIWGNLSSRFQSESSWLALSWCMSLRSQHPHWIHLCRRTGSTCTRRSDKMSNSKWIPGFN